jgi:DME family drug/metabolite transporter
MIAAHPGVAGTLFGLTAAVLYTGSNICARSVHHDDSMWLSCVREFPILVLFGPWFISLVWRKKQVFPPKMRVFVILLVGAITNQFAGNVTFFYSLKVLGIAIAVPFLLGGVVTSGAVLGWLFLREHVALRSVAAMGVLLAAISLLGVASYQAIAATAGETIAMPDSSSPLVLASGLAAVLTASISYAMFAVVIRYVLSNGCPLPTTLVTCGLSGVIVLGTICGLRSGVQLLIDTTAGDYAFMLGAGVGNALAFLALTNALKRIRVANVNSLNASQSAMAAVAGVLLFREPLSLALVGGVLLTIVGLVAMNGRDKEEGQSAKCEGQKAEEPL